MDVITNKKQGEKMNKYQLTVYFADSSSKTTVVKALDSHVYDAVTSWISEIDTTFNPIESLDIKFIKE